MPNWPSSLPALQWVGYQETLPDGTLRTQMDAGPAKVRRRFTAAVRPVKGQISTNEAGVAALESFYLVDCNGGATSFVWSLARAGGPQNVNFRFTKPPVISPAADGNGRYLVALELEILP